MAITWKDDDRDVDWQALSDLYRQAPLGDKHPADLKTVFGNSMFKRFVVDDGVLVGAGRVLADGVDTAYLCDVAVLPSHQGMGLGRELVATLIGLSLGHRKIILYAAPGREAFYAKLGFRPMTTAMAIFLDPAQAAAHGYIV